MEFCATLPPGIYERPFAELPSGFSIRTLHGHIAECYLHWLGNLALGKSIDLMKFEELGFENIRKKFLLVDAVVEEFSDRFSGDPSEKIADPNRNSFSALWLFTHTVTHEFHHKGQIVLLGRQLGHPAPDTDLVWP